MQPTNHWQIPETMHYRRYQLEKETFKAMCFVLRLDESRYGDLLDELRKEVYKGRDKYPNTVFDRLRTYHEDIPTDRIRTNTAWPIWLPCK